MILNKGIISSCIVVVFGMIGVCQQSSLVSLAYKDPFRIIPSSGGLKGTLMGSGIYRNQWQGLDGHPKGVDLSLHFPIFQISSTSGVSIGQEKLGLETHTFLKPGIYKVIKSDSWIWSIGLQAEFDWISFDSKLARTPEGNYQNPEVDHKDPLVSNQQGSQGIFDFGVSSFISWKQFSFGINVEKLLESSQAAADFPWKNRRNLKILGLFEYEWMKILWKPHLLIYTDFNQLQADFIASFEYGSGIFGGIHLRGFDNNSLESMGLSFGFDISKSLQLAYCHEFYIGAIPAGIPSSSQEIGLFYNLGKAFGLGRPPKIIHNPRYSD